MIIYFANRKMEIIDLASTFLPNGLRLSDDLKIENVETGVASFECKIYYTKATRPIVSECVKAGNYLLRKHANENEFYTIIEVEEDTDGMFFDLYAEDAGLDLLNEIVGPIEYKEPHPIADYVNEVAWDSGFEIGRNDIPDLTRKLKWDGESTGTERLASIAHQFDHCEISYSFEVKGLEVTKKLINIHKKRGQDNGIQLRQNKEVENIQIKTSIANLATGLKVTGGTPKNAKKPIDLNGYHYDDGEDFYVIGSVLASRKALAKWSRFVWKNEPKPDDYGSGHILARYSYDTTNQETLCKRAITELKRRREPEINYEMDVLVLPENVGIGDRVNVINDEIGFYINSRILKLETSISNATKKATLGEHLIRKSGIADKLLEMAEDLAGNIVVDGKDATLMRLESPSGNVFMDNSCTSDVTVSLYKGIQHITDIEGLLREYGDAAILKWYVKTESADMWQLYQGATLGGFKIHVAATDFENSISYKCELMVGDALIARDHISFGKLEEPIQVDLSMDSATFQGSETAAIESSVPVTIKATKGGKQLPCHVVISELAKKSGVRVVTDGQLPSPTLTITLTSAVTENGLIMIPVHVDNNGEDKIINKVFNYAIAFKGQDGTVGQDALVMSITSSKGEMFKENIISTMLTVHVFKGGKELTDEQIAEYGVITWECTENPTTAQGKTCAVTAEGKDKLNYTATLGTSAKASITLMKVISIKNIYRFYCLQDGTLAPPDAPSVFPPYETDIWKDTEPPYNPETDVGMKMYVVDCNEFSDGSYVYTPVSVVSSYEVAQDTVKRVISVQKDMEFIDLRFVPIEQSISNYERYIRFENGNMIIGEQGLNGETILSAVHTADSLEFRKNGQVVGKFTSDGLDTRNVTVDNHVSHFGQWSVRKGVDDGYGNYNLNDVWIGG